MPKIVININEEIYNGIKHGMRNRDDVENIMEQIENGTPLPKWHGRLIDVDALYDSTKLCHTEEDGTACVEWREINDAPTIIEADKENET